MSSRQSKSSGSSSKGSSSTGSSKSSNTSSRSTSTAKSSSSGSRSAPSAKSSTTSSTSTPKTSSTASRPAQASKSSTTSSKSSSNIKSSSTTPKSNASTKSSSALPKSSASSNNTLDSLLFNSDGFSSSAGLVYPSVLESFLNDHSNLGETRSKGATRKVTKDSDSIPKIRTTRSPNTLVYNPSDHIFNGIINDSESKSSSKKSQSNGNRKSNSSPKTTRTIQSPNSFVSYEELVDPLEQINQILYGSTSDSNQVGKSRSSGSVKKSQNSKTTKVSVEKDQEPKRSLRSDHKYKDFTHDVKKVTDFSIDNYNDTYKKDEDYYQRKVKLALSDFEIPKESRREGNEKLSYNYLLLDPRKCSDTSNMSWEQFLDATFYVGKGKNNRAFDHTKDAQKLDAPSNKKINTIKEIWNDQQPVKVLQLTKDIIAEEAYTREASMIDALGKERLTNRARSTYYGVATTIPARDKLEIGGALLVDAWQKLRIDGATDVLPKSSNNISSRSSTNNINESIFNGIVNDRNLDEALENSVFNYVSNPMKIHDVIDNY